MSRVGTSLVVLVIVDLVTKVRAQQPQATPPAPAPTYAPAASTYGNGFVPKPIQPLNYRTPAPSPTYNVQPTYPVQNGYNQNTGINQPSYPNNQIRPVYNHVLNRSAHCDEHQFHFTVEFALPFSGRIYAQNAPHCTFVGADGPNAHNTYSEWQQQPSVSNTVFSIQLPLSAACGTEMVDKHDYKQFSVGLRIEDGVNAAFMLVCRHRKTQINTTPHSTPDVSYQIRPPTEEVLTHTVNLNDEASVRFDSRIVFGDGIAGYPVDRTVELGERLSFAFRCSTTPLSPHPSQPAYALNNHVGTGAVPRHDCGVAECTARGQSGNVVQLTDNNGCSLHPPFWSDFQQSPHSKPGERVFYSAFWAWGLHSDVHMTIKCRLRICPGECPSVNCASVVRPPYGHAHVHPNTQAVHDTYPLSPPTGQPPQAGYQPPQSGYNQPAYDDPLLSVYETGTELSLQTAAIYEVDSEPAVVQMSAPVTVCLQQSLFTSLTGLWLTVLFILVLSNLYSYYRLRKMMKK